MDGDALTRSLQDFLAESRDAVVIEGGEVVFDFATAKYACVTEHGKCLLHLWSDERNTVRRVLDSEMKNGALLTPPTSPTAPTTNLVSTISATT